MLIEIEEIKIANIDLFLPSEYEENSLNLVNDGIAFHLVTCINGIVNLIPLPNKDILKSYANTAGARCKEDTERLLANKLEGLHKMIEGNMTKFIDSKREDIVIPTTQNFNIKDLTELIAVAQKPDLLK